MSAPCASPFPMFGVWAVPGVGFGAGFPIVQPPRALAWSASQLWALKPGHAPGAWSWGKKGEIHFIHAERSLGLLNSVPHPPLAAAGPFGTRKITKNWVISPKCLSAAL